MNANFESELRAAFVQRASDVGSDSVARVREHRYRPTRRRTRARVAVAVSGLGAVAAALGVIAAGLGSSSPAAYASWSSTPTQATVGQVAGAETACLFALSTHVANSAGPTFISDMSAWQFVIEDVQGPYVLVGLTASQDGATNEATCLAPTETTWSHGPQIIIDNEAGGGAGFGGPITRNSSVQTTLTGGSISANSTPSSPNLIANPSIQTVETGVTFVVGHAGSAVSAVTLEQSDGTNVVATVANGYYAAWWPSDATLTSAQVTSPSGITTETLPVSVQPAGSSNSQVRAPR